MNNIKRLLPIFVMLMAFATTAWSAEFSAKEVVLEHIKDSHEWHITGEGESALVIPLPVIVNSRRATDILMDWNW